MAKLRMKEFSMKYFLVHSKSNVFVSSVKRDPSREGVYLSAIAAILGVYVPASTSYSLFECDYVMGLTVFIVLFIRYM